MQRKKNAIRDMCTCLDNIRDSYTKVRRGTSRVARRSFRSPIENKVKSQVDIDDFLDAINLFTRELHQLTTSINDLVEVVRNNFCEITTSEAEELLGLSEPIYKNMQLLHKKLLKSSLYVGMETVVNLYADAMSDFDELCHDLKTFRVDLEQNTEFQESLSKLSDLLAQ